MFCIAPERVRREADATSIELPALLIDDAPALTHRGFMLDVSRNKARHVCVSPAGRQRAQVPKLETLFGIVDTLASLKYNQLQLYMEHTFAYKDHPSVVMSCSTVLMCAGLCGPPRIHTRAPTFWRWPSTAAVASSIWCRTRTRWATSTSSCATSTTVSPRTAHRRSHGADALAECPRALAEEYGRTSDFTLCPTDPRSVALVEYCADDWRRVTRVQVASLYQELFPHFASPFANVGLDEPFDLGMRRALAAADDLRRQARAAPRLHASSTASSRCTWHICFGFAAALCDVQLTRPDPRGGEQAGPHNDVLG